MLKDFDEFLKTALFNHELNHIPLEFSRERIFDDPLIGVAAGNDSIYEKFKEVIGPEHYTPIEIWRESEMPDLPRLAERLRVVSIAFPFTLPVRQAGRQAVDKPARIYMLARNHADDLARQILREATAYLNNQGYEVMIPMLSKPYHMVARQDPPRLYSNWSERHSAFAAGLGSFSLHEAFISEKGCNIRLGSLITDAPFEVTLRRSDDPYANCLHYAKGICRECEKRCPGGAIGEKGHDKLACLKFLKGIEQEFGEILGGVLKPDQKNVNGNITMTYPVGCAFCQFGTPCMDKNPLAKTGRG